MKKFLKYFYLLIFFNLIFLTNGFSLASQANLDENPPFSYVFVNPVEIKNFHKVDENFYRGGQPNDFDIETLSAMGIKTIINLRNPYIFNNGILKQKTLAKHLGMQYYNIPLTPRTPPNAEQIKIFFSIIDNPKNLPVFVHCAQGRDRTGIMTALYRVRNYGWNYDQAYFEMKQRGYHERLFPQHKDFLSSFVNIFRNSQLTLGY